MRWPHHYIILWDKSIPELSHVENESPDPVEPMFPTPAQPFSGQISNLLSEYFVSITKHSSGQLKLTNVQDDPKTLSSLWAMLNIVRKAYSNNYLMTQFSRYWKMPKKVTHISVLPLMKAILIHCLIALKYKSGWIIIVNISQIQTWTFLGVKTTSRASLILSFRFPVGDSIPPTLFVNE